MRRETLLVRTLVELVDSLVDDFDVVEMLTKLCDRCVESLDAAAAGVMLASPSGQLRVVASSSDAMRILELFELQADEGPCVDCYRTGAAVVNRELGGTSRLWPQFSPRAIEAGFLSVHALPMRLRARTIGALNLFRADAGSLDDEDVQAAQALADVATIAIIQHQTEVDAHTVNDQLNHALTSRVVIEQAKGRISEADDLDMAQAFLRLRGHARNHNLRLVDVATDVAQGAIDLGSLDPLPSRTSK